MQEQGVFTKNLSLIGHSMGGSVSTQLILNQLPVNELILISSSPEWESLKVLADVPAEQISIAFQGMMTQDFSVNTTPELKELLLPQIESMAASGEAGVADIKALINFNVKDLISTITIPVVVIYGDTDDTATVANQKFFIDNFPNVTSYKLVGATHTTVIKNAEEIAELLEDYFQS